MHMWFASFSCFMFSLSVAAKTKVSVDILRKSSSTALPILLALSRIAGPKWEELLPANRNSHNACFEGVWGQRKPTVSGHGLWEAPTRGMA